MQVRAEEAITELEVEYRNHQKVCPSVVDAQDYYHNSLLTQYRILMLSIIFTATLAYTGGRETPNVPSPTVSGKSTSQNCEAVLGKHRNCSLHTPGTAWNLSEALRGTLVGQFRPEPYVLASSDTWGMRTLPSAFSSHFLFCIYISSIATHLS